MKRRVSKITNASTAAPEKRPKNSHGQKRQKKKKQLKQQSSQSQSQPVRCLRYRDLTRLYTCRDTYVCARDRACIPCSYKIGAFDVALDTDFTRAVPNLRPEMCKRSEKNNSTINLPSHPLLHDDTTFCYGYSKRMRILTVGDGDFSFSLALARMICKRAGSVGGQQEGKRRHEKTLSLLQDDKDSDIPCLVATSYESYDTLCRVYPLIQRTLDELAELNVQVCFNVDATDLMGTLPPIYVGKHASSLEEDSFMSVSSNIPSRFHRIIWNFPCTAIANGQDGQNQEMEENQWLVKKFVKECQNFLSPHMGEIHFLHKTKPPYDQWNLEEIAIEMKQGDHNNIWDRENDPCPFVYKGRVVFDRCLLVPYIPRKALDRKSFPCHDACLFVFGWNNNNVIMHQHPTKNDGKNGAGATVTDANHHGMDDGTWFHPTIPAGPQYEHENIIPVTSAMIDELRYIHMSLGSYQDRKYCKNT